MQVCDTLILYLIPFINNWLHVNVNTIPIGTIFYVHKYLSLNGL